MRKSRFTPLRYPGGKAKLFNYTVKLLEENNLIGCTYVEPFAGGSGLALELLFKDKVSKIILNDIDKSIYAFWYSVLNNPEELIDIINKNSVNIDEWHKQKEIQKDKESVSLLDLAYSTLFLNRTNRSGILTAGPIGGKLQTGNYKLDCRFKKDIIIEKIRLISSKKDKISFYNYDAIDFMKKIISRQKKETFVFFDPPYYEKGPELYLNSFNDEAHQELATNIKCLKKHWIVTYDDTSFIKDLYSDCNYTIYELNYSLNVKKKAKEIMVYGPSITKTNHV